MIIVKLKGGLGNQLFQYALGRHLSEINNTNVKLDISFFETYKLHAYSLKPFHIKEIIASPQEVDKLVFYKSGALEEFIRRQLHRPRRFASTYIGEKEPYFDPEILKLSDDVYLDGYWQSEEYFSSISEIIKNEFVVKTSPLGYNKKLLNLIESCNSVSLHVRRGSYTIPPFSEFHGTCSLKYYEKGINYISEFIEQPTFFIFSDDLAWARENIKLKHRTIFVGHNNALNDFEDLRLISFCKHQIIANSTFSWWGAWLNSNPEKIVITPSQWFLNENYNSKTHDLIPKNWIKL